jgi:hypothetical protein
MKVPEAASVRLQSLGGGSCPKSTILSRRSSTSAQDIIDQSRDAIAATKQAIDESRKLLKRLKQAANRPLIPPHSN